VPSADPRELAEVPLFESLSEPERAEVAARFEVKEVGPGVRLVTEGATGLSFFILQQGVASVTAGDEEIASLRPGDFFGEIALRHGRRTATVTTTSPVRLLVLFGDDFRRLEADFPAVAAEIEAATKKRLEQS
jgi:CRP/FNR family transcriptional regulator, cyclic AMP receptor protein